MSSLDRPLEELIGNRREGGRGRRGGRGRGRGDGVGGRHRNFREGRSPYSRGADQDRWGHDGFEHERGDRSDRGHNRDRAPRNNGPQGSKVKVENLKFDVLESDLEDLFSKTGRVESVKVFYDKSGRSLGEAEVVFRSELDAEEAVKV
eukprot:TRINITY_DN824_c1_g1_i4.p1 TRINITY_DN824_c1_g1~~TRINITY_DN824_c1_g1_i4.p1  ORF type:complete len:148 (-),score=41.16 TRINITY_DN824_c1_g1_i4:87-530(-)